MADPALEALAAEIVELSKTYEPPRGGLMAKPPLVLKAEELIRTVQSPVDHALSLITTLAEASALRALLSLGVFDALPAHGEGISVEHLSDRSPVRDVQPALLARLLRILVGSGLVGYDVEARTYAHTRLSQGYVGSDLADFLFPYIFDEIALTTRLSAYFRARGASEPDGEKAITHNPATWAAGQEGKTVFEVLEQDPEKLKRFVQLMAAADRFRPWTGFYDYGKLAEGVEEGRPVLVDVGGADGTCVARILEAHPEIRPERCVVQDREKVIAAAEANEKLPKGVQLQAHDFFTPQPITHAKAYHLRAITHDWSDTAVVKILSQIVPAMASDSKLLIADNVLPETGGSGMAAFMDLAMLCIGGKERTRRDFEAVVGASGLKIDEVYPAAGEVGFAVVECSLR